MIQTESLSEWASSMSTEELLSVYADMSESCAEGEALERINLRMDALQNEWFSRLAVAQ